jgi:hypothetical protein
MCPSECVRVDTTRRVTAERHGTARRGEEDGSAAGTEEQWGKGTAHTREIDPSRHPTLVPFSRRLPLLLSVVFALMKQHAARRSPTTGDETAHFHTKHTPQYDNTRNALQGIFKCARGWSLSIHDRRENACCICWLAWLRLLLLRFAICLTCQRSLRCAAHLSSHSAHTQPNTTTDQNEW